MDTKLCTRCNTRKPLDEFNHNRVRSDGRSTYCRICTREYANTYYRAKSHDCIVAKQYGLERGEYAMMIEEQGGVCAMCGRPETATFNGRPKRLSIDHDHVTGAVRALLCLACNALIGYAHDDTERLRAAITYLSRDWTVRERPVFVPLRIAKCGTYSGYTAHFYRGEKPCDPCKEARREYDRSRKASTT